MPSTLFSVITCSSLSLSLYSNLPSENEQSKSTSTSSSAFVTPYSTRSQSPVLSKTGSDSNGQVGIQDELTRALADLSEVTDKHENTDSSGIASDVSKDTVVGGSSARDSSSYEEKSSGCRDSDEREPPAAIITPRPPAMPSSGNSSSGKSVSKKRLNCIQRSKGRRAEQARSDSAAQGEETGRAKETEIQKKTNGSGLRHESRGMAHMSPTNVTRKHPNRNKSRKAAGAEHQDKSGCLQAPAAVPPTQQHSVRPGQQNRVRKPQPLLLPTTDQNKQGQPAVESHPLPPPKGQKASQLRVEFHSLSSASPASSVCSCSPLTLSPSPTSSLQLHQPILTTDSLSASLLVQHQVGVDTNLTSAATGPQPDLVDQNNLTVKEDDDSKDEWPDFGLLSSHGDKPCSSQVSSMRNGNAGNVPVEHNVVPNLDSHQKDQSRCAHGKPTLPHHLPFSSTSATSQTPSTNNFETPSSAYKVVDSTSELLPSLSEFPSSAFKVISPHADLLPRNEVPSSAFKVPFSCPEVVLTSAPSPSMATSEEPKPSLTLDQTPEPGNESSSSEAPASVVAATEEAEEEHDSGCNMSTCSGSAESASSTGGGALAGNQPLEHNAQYPIMADSTLNPLCEPVSQHHHLSPNQYLQLKRNQLTMFVQQYQEKVEKQTDDQIFFPVDPPPPTSHMTMMISPPVQILSPPPMQMMTPTIFLQSPPPPLHHHHPVVADIRTSLVAGAPPFLSSSPPPPPPPPLPPNLPYDIMLPPPTEVPPVTGFETSMVAAPPSVHSINVSAGKYSVLINLLAPGPVCSLCCIQLCLTFLISGKMMFVCHVLWCVL